MEAIFHGHEKDAGIYLIRNRVNARVYVGDACRFRSRFRSHLRKLKRGDHRNRCLQSDYQEHGPNAFSFEVVAIVPDAKERRTVEVETIRRLFGEGCYNAVIEWPPFLNGRKLSDETRSKISAARKSQEFTEETRRKISASRVGQRLAPETRAKIGASQKGRKRQPYSEEARRHMSLPGIGRRPSDETRAKMSEAQKNAWATGRRKRTR